MNCTLKYWLKKSIWCKEGNRLLAIPYCIRPCLIVLIQSDYTWAIKLVVYTLHLFTCSFKFSLQLATSHYCSHTSDFISHVDCIKQYHSLEC